MWLILDAAGETEIGENPSLEAAKGVRLTADNFKKLFKKGHFTARVRTPPGLTEKSEKSFTVSFFPDGKLSIFQENVPAEEGFEDTGEWWFEGGIFCNRWNRLRSGRKDCIYLVLDKKKIKTYTLNGTLDSQLKIIRE
ncbi:MAG: hypothetical protein B6I22_09825 [Desulfobacteraceae bacterium 4572_123]|nr:MAG: hypothetical protein B6I22_09825 [Desulfobacteraceae bacterium 4572_123]